MRKLSISSSPKSNPTIVFTNSPPGEIIYLIANWCNSNHLLKLKESKQKKLTSSKKEQFLRVSKQDQLRNVVYEHGPSELKMVHVKTCLVLGTDPSVDFFKNGSKDKERVYEFLWNSHKLIQNIQDGYVSPYAETFVLHSHLYY